MAPFAIKRRELRANDVALDILHSGVCHSDLHQARNDWHNSIYPVVPGHEINGRVSAIGSGVTALRRMIVSRELSRDAKDGASKQKSSMSYRPALFPPT